MWLRRFIYFEGKGLRDGPLIVILLVFDMFARCSIHVGYLFVHPEVIFSGVSALQNIGDPKCIRAQLYSTASQRLLKFFSS